ncbi:LOG family protein [Enterococcus sp. LJL120]
MNITVYCGASVGNADTYSEAAIRLGKWIAKNQYTLIFGGGKAGLMGIIADTVLENDGKVKGIMPTFLQERELAHPKLTDLEIVDDMATRTKKMIQLADACIALPGGPGTLEEITEAISWSRVGQNDAPCILFNEGDYYQPLEKMYDDMVNQKFLSSNDRDKILFSADLTEIERFIKDYQPPQARKY